MSIRYKIALLFAILVAFHLIGAGLFVYYYSLEERKATFEERLKNRALVTAKIFSSVTDGDFSVLNKMDAGTVASLYDRSISILNYSGTYDYMYADTPGDSLVLSEQMIAKTKIEGEHMFSYKGRTIFAIHRADDNSNFILAIAASDRDGVKYLGELRDILLLAGVAGIILSFFAGVFFAGNLVRPIKRMIGEVDLISTNNLSQRLQVGETNDELNGLALTLNTLLDRLQESFTIQRRFISNASHELSTPLTSISSQLEVSMQKVRTEEEYRGVIASVYEDIRGLQVLTRSLLDIAQAGSQGSIDLSDVRLDEVIVRVAADVQKLDKSYNVLIDFRDFPEEEGYLMVFGNANLLYIAFKNIVENGCKYSVNHTCSVVVSFEQPKIIVRVSSMGDIIAESDIQNIFQPFFRTEGARTKQGSGLGLTLTKRILSLHQSTISVTSKTDTGTVFVVSLPCKAMHV